MRVKIEEPTFNQIRYIKKFALLPFFFIKKDDKIMIWMEWYWQRQTTSGNHYWSNADKFPIEHQIDDAT